MVGVEGLGIPHLFARVPRAAGSGTPSVHCGTAGWDPFSTLPHCRGQWVVKILHFTATLQGSLDSGTPSVHHRTVCVCVCVCGCVCVGGCGCVCVCVGGWVGVDVDFGCGWVDGCVGVGVVSMTFS